MVKKCIICQARNASFCIKGTNNCYCYACAVDHFGDVGLLVKMEDDAVKLENFIDERINEDVENDNYRAVRKANDDVLIDVKINKKITSDLEKINRLFENEENKVLKALKTKTAKKPVKAKTKKSVSKKAVLKKGIKAKTKKKIKKDSPLKLAKTKTKKK